MSIWKKKGKGKVYVMVVSISNLIPLEGDKPQSKPSKQGLPFLLFQIFNKHFKKDSTWSVYKILLSFTHILMIK